jgi:hypothetical protein
MEDSKKPYIWYNSHIGRVQCVFPAMVSPSAGLNIEA